MNLQVKPVPEGYHTVTPYILVNNVSKALEFYKFAFGAEELVRLEIVPGQIAHAEFKIGNSVIMISEISPQTNSIPVVSDGRYVSFMVYVDDVETSAKRAVQAGMKIIKEVQDQFYGDRSGTFQDPFGHVWSIGTHIEDVSNDEARRRMQNLCESQSLSDLV